MILGALLELGAPPAKIRAQLAKLGIPELRMRVSKVRRGGIAASYVGFGDHESHGHAHHGEHGHGHHGEHGHGHHGEHGHAHARRYKEIRGLLGASDLDDAVAARSLSVFERLARAEAKIHGVELDAVHFHEIGAIDTLGDVVGTAAAMEALGVGRVTCSPLALGTGTVRTEHGVLPLPAPATAELLRGVPTYPAPVDFETVTPTGAAILVEYVEAFGPMPALVLDGQGFGAGNDRAAPMPNVLRAILGAPDPILEADTVVVLETNIDDMTPEALPFLLERLMEEGALDASFQALSMKKGRPGQLLRVISRPQDRDRLARRVLAESSAIGVRQVEMPRLKLVRESRRVDTPFGRIRVKRVTTPDGRVSASPEYEDCARSARRHGVPLLEVYRAAEQAARTLDD